MMPTDFVFWRATSLFFPSGLTFLAELHLYSINLRQITFCLSIRVHRRGSTADYDPWKEMML